MENLIAEASWNEEVLIRNRVANWTLPLYSTVEAV
jgi:hypothetical protein